VAKRESDELKQARKDLETLRFIMSRCGSDSAYRVYAAREDALVDKINSLERTRVSP
jgi:hypothetical protein